MSQRRRRQNGFTIQGKAAKVRSFRTILRVVVARVANRCCISAARSQIWQGAVKETSQGTFAKGVDTKWPETQTVAKGVTSLLPRKSDEIFNFKPPPRRQETVSVPPRG